MLTEKFDPYGEVLPDAAGGKPETAASAMLGRVGQYAFWLLVVIIVSVRIVYYPAAPAFQVGAAADVQQVVIR
ncbi:MAG: hypothetical protein Q7U92_00690 [Bradyrhizobium sp.]|uniref:hypothetical protein n=1 Tax=Bradyrhizobium sp. TaxID=376 RepID=UPI0027270E91|nr:hypothetical protein [Bradyrhizobium sp.]MDO9057523.1 hypothetical protein [Bradyrhizobium sp.]MDO9564848.1 hypothetical protein [Bradyrhizobium sp.]MDP3693522.1 hypothetical protein [Bradyrhizobium sp.]